MFFIVMFVLIILNFVDKCENGCILCIYYDWYFFVYCCSYIWVLILIIFNLVKYIYIEINFYF